MRKSRICFLLQWDDYYFSPGAETGTALEAHLKLTALSEKVSNLGKGGIEWVSNNSNTWHLVTTSKTNISPVTTLEARTNLENWLIMGSD